MTNCKNCEFSDIPKKIRKDTLKCNACELNKSLKELNETLKEIFTDIINNIPSIGGDNHGN